jgi:tetratricopeptide (TPR) repeat protein
LWLKKTMKPLFTLVLLLMVPGLVVGQGLDGLLEQQVELGRISEVRADERIKLLEAFIKKGPNSPLVTPAREMMVRARAALAESFLKQQRPEQAIEQFQLAFEQSPQPISDRFFLSFIRVFPATLLSYGYREEAILLMRKFEAAFQQPVRLEQIGLFYLNADSAEDAARVLGRAIELDPKDHKHYQSMANACLIGLKLDEAKQNFQRAITLEPKEPVAYGALAQLYRSEGAYEDAIALYTKQLEVTPEHESAHGGLAITYLLMKNEPMAEAELAKQFAITPRDFRLFTQLAYIACGRGEFARARRWAELALSIAPTYAWARMVMAYLLVTQQDFTTSEELLSDALARGAGFPTIHFELIKTLLLAEDYAGAFEQSERLLTITAEGEFEVRLGGVLTARSRSLKSLLEKERRAALGLPESFTPDSQYSLVENFLRFQFYLSRLQPRTVQTEKAAEGAVQGRRQRMELQVRALEALAQMLGVEDERGPFRKLWAAERLLAADIALEKATELCLDALREADAATRLEGSMREAPDLDRAARKRLFEARANQLVGRVRYKQGQTEEAIKWFELAVKGFGEGAEQRAALRQLASATQAAGRDNEALALYIRGYNPYDENAALQRSLIESLYRKLHGSLEGLDLK